MKMIILLTMLSALSCYAKPAPPARPDPDTRAACVRALRADVCGTGVSHTVDGVALEVAVGPRALERAEATWNRSGATCVSLASRPQLVGAAIDCGVPVAARCAGPALVSTRLP